MKDILANYSVIPKIVLSGEKSTITIRPLGAHAIFKLSQYLVEFVPMAQTRAELCDYDLQTVFVSEDGAIHLSYTFQSEQEYKIRLYDPNDRTDESKKRDPSPKKALYDFRVYSLFEDLYKLRPYRGEFHSHSCCSDGKQDPETTAANFRKAGYDFYSLTDHHRYRPSVQCQNYYADKPIDFVIVRGEEVHSPYNHIHVINFGGTQSINEMFRNDLDTYNKEVEAIIQKTELPPSVNAFEYAACLLAFRKIKETGGLSVYCHPHWMEDAYHSADDFSDALFESGEFCAFELLGGHEAECNNIQVAYWSEQRAKGNGCPVVGVSDAHNTNAPEAKYIKWTYTVIFSENLEVSSIQNAVRSSYSVAVEQYPGEASRAYGDFRMVKYTRFLLEEYFPMHDELCFEEGRLMKDMFEGCEKAPEILKMLQGRCAELLNRFWGI